MYGNVLGFTGTLLRPREQVPYPYRYLRQAATYVTKPPSTTKLLGLSTILFRIVKSFSVHQGMPVVA